MKRPDFHRVVRYSEYDSRLRGACSCAARFLGRIRGIHPNSHDCATSRPCLDKTLLRAWEHRDRLHGDTGAVRDWLLTVARNLIIDRLRHPVSRYEYVSPETAAVLGIPAGTVKSRHHYALRLLRNRAAPARR
ncbi:sigma factor [Streptomyces griseoluteus]|uniref:sigma factor n=1 Tax=Streptomyces griseoluteus TaxID=29306 RepID=UPI0036FD7759